jgi:hypothetical protein
MKKVKNIGTSLIEMVLLPPFRGKKKFPLSD